MRRILLEMTINARQLRHNQTDAEKLLWSLLRGRRFIGYKFRRQVVIDKYIADFYCAKAKLIIELDGGQHNFPENIIRDEIRTHDLQSYGMTILRFWNNEIFENINDVLEKIGKHPHP